MRQNETNAANRLIGPIPFYDLDGQLLKNQTFQGALGEVKYYRSDTNAWVNASGNAFELGGANTSGIYGYVFSQAETNYPSILGVQLSKSGYNSQFQFVPVDDRRDAIELLAAMVRLLGLHRENTVMDGGPGIAPAAERAAGLHRVGAVRGRHPDPGSRPRLRKQGGRARRDARRQQQHRRRDLPLPDLVDRRRHARAVVPSREGHVTIGIATDGYIGSFGSGGPGAVFTSTDPIVGETIDADDSIELVIESPAGGVSVQELEVRYIGSLTFVSVYTQGGGWVSEYSDSELVLLDGIATITLVRNAGWPLGIAEVRMQALDNAAAESFDVAGSWFLGGEDGDGDDDGPDPIPGSDQIGTVIEIIDLVERAINRLPEYLRP